MRAVGVGKLEGEVVVESFEVEVVKVEDVEVVEDNVVVDVENVAVVVDDIVLVDEVVVIVAGELFGISSQ